MIPANPAPNTYLSRVGPKPLNINAPLPPRDEVLRLLPPLATGLPSREPDQSSSREIPAETDTLFPVPADRSISGVAEPLKLPENWVESLLGPPLPLPGTEPASRAGEAMTGDGVDDGRPRQLTPEDLVPFFVSPGAGGDARFVIPVPFVPGVPGASQNPPTSSKATFRQE